jgi:hypothetical protein
MKRINFTFLAAALLAVLPTACGSDALLGEIKLASSVNEHGQPIAEATTFTRGNTVYLSVELRQAYEGLTSKATWKRGAEVLATDSIDAPRPVEPFNPLFIVFELKTEVAWPAGAYRCELFVPDQGTTVFEFTLI